MTADRRGAVVALLLLGALLTATIAATTPWRPLPGPVPGGRTAADPTRDFGPAERARAAAFHREVRPPAYAGLLLGLVVAGGLGLTPLGARLVGALPGVWPLRVALGSFVVTALPALATLPLQGRVEVVLRRHGLSTRTWAGWGLDQAKGWALGAALLTVAAVGFVAVARAAPRTWWLWNGLGAAALVVVVSFAYPLVVEPVFNRFTPLPAGPLRTGILELARRDGVPVRDVLVADASRRTTTLNAYVSGLGSSRRVVVYDTLLRRATPEEVTLVVAHELGHVRNHDVRDGTLLGALGAAAAVALLYLLLTWSPLVARAGVSGAADPRVLALLVFLVGGLSQASRPVQALVSRRVEARADVHSLELTRDPATFVQAERRLAAANRSDLDPHPLVYAIFFTHPSAPERIALARDWARREGVAVP